MTLYIEKSGTGIEKSGTGIEKSGTGIERSGTGINRSGTGSRRGLGHVQTILSAATFLGASIAQAGSPASHQNLLLTQSENTVQVSLHIDQQVIVGRAESAEALDGLVQLNLYDVQDLASAGIETHGSGTGIAGRCSGADIQTHGSGTGSPEAEDVGFTIDTHGSGTGGIETHGSGTGRIDTHGSGTGRIDTHGSGTGGIDTHGSGTGSPQSDTSQGDRAAHCGSRVARWGQVELVIDPDATYVLVHRDGADGPEEILATIEAPVSMR